MESISITKTGTTTVVSITDGNSTRKMAVTAAVNFRTFDGVKKIVFPDNYDLDQFNITVDKLAAGTLTALSLTTASTTVQLFDALVAGAFFEGK